MGMSNSGQTPRRGGVDMDETGLGLASQVGHGLLDKVRASQPGVGLLSQGQGFPARGRNSQLVGIGILS